MVEEDAAYVQIECKAAAPRHLRGGAVMKPELETSTCLRNLLSFHHPFHYPLLLSRFNFF